MKWIDLFEFLSRQANDVKNLGSFDWQKEIKIYDRNIGLYYSADLMIEHHNNRTVLDIDTLSGDNDGS